MKLSTKIAHALVAFVIIVAPFHAFLTVWASTAVGHFALLRLWDDVLLLVLVGIVCGWLLYDGQLRQTMWHSWLLRTIAVYSGVTLVVGVIALFQHAVTTKAFGYAVLVNIRFLLWLLGVWAVALRSPWLSKVWPKLVFGPLLAVAVFALLQFFVLPNDFLSHFGYNKTTTFAPYITINQNTSTMRAQSFLRGTNPLGAYMVLALGLLAVCLMDRKRHLWQAALAVLAAIALVLSFSRGAWIGTIVTVAAAAWLSLKKSRSRRWFFAALGTGLVLLLVGAALFQHNHGVQDALFHVSAGSTAQQTSNAGHAAALRSSLHELWHQPFGDGPGTAGPASWYNQPHGIHNTENYFLEIGLELGWLGLGLFVAIIVLVARELALRQTSLLARGLLAALIGLSVVNLLTYGWSDDSLAFVYWGLVGISLGSSRRL